MSPIQSPIQSAVLPRCIGRQREGWLRATHQKITDKLGVERSNVTRAISRLEHWHLIQRVDNGLIFVHPMLGFEGNGDVRREIVDALRDKETGKLPGDVFPAQAQGSRHRVAARRARLRHCAGWINRSDQPHPLSAYT
ncbi:hypothetical protein ACFC09_35210 [Streptomyces sp. NPDC056161]|uniref:hypothetical protein n=1 Tax=Streptomyces sp. NPDC056161 TaxID=3345732 RepID=UPI0035DC8CE2